MISGTDGVSVMSAELSGPAPWVCPWGICNHDEAQKCRANKELRKRTQRGCGTYFFGDVTAEEARRMVAPLNTGSTNTPMSCIPPESNVSR